MASQPDAAAIVALGADRRRPVSFVYMDLAHEQLRVTNAPYSMEFAGTGDEDLDGHLFDAVDGRFVSVSPITVALDGTDTVTLRLSGLAGVDDELMTEIGNKANFQGRDCRIWQAMLDPDNFARIGAIWTLMTGYMNVPKILGDRQSQILELEVESYLGFMKRASGRTYLEQQNFDPGDRSGELAIAIANGAGNRS